VVLCVCVCVCVYVSVCVCVYLVCICVCALDSYLQVCGRVRMQETLAKLLHFHRGSITAVHAFIFHVMCKRTLERSR
jgi:hypothetical protein